MYMISPIIKAVTHNKTYSIDIESQELNKMDIGDIHEEQMNEAQERRISESEQDYTE